MVTTAAREHRRDPDRRGEPERGPQHRAPRSRAGPAVAVTSRHDVSRCVVRPAVAAPGPYRATAVSRPGDACETHAEAVAARVVRGAGGAPPAPRLPPGAGIHRAAGPGGTGAATSGGPVPPAVDRVLAAPYGGRPIPAEVRRRIEPHLGADLAAVRVLTGPRASLAAASLGARAFTAGSTIVLGAGQSPSDPALMAHEATHVAQQASGRHGVHRATIMRDLLDSVPSMPDLSLSGFVRSVPGYRLLTELIGVDPLTGVPVEADQRGMIDELLSYGPFGAGVGPALQAMDALGEVAEVVTGTLARYGLTISRLERDVQSAWQQVSITNSLDDNIAIVGRVVDALLADVRRFVADLVERILAIVREAALDLVEPLLTGNETIAPIWSLATKVFHHDPLRGVPVEAATVDILAGFLHLIGQDAALDQMRERGTLQETAAWLDGQIATFAGLLEQATSLFTDAWAAIQPENLATLPQTLPGLAQRAFTLIAGVGAFAGTVLAEVVALVKRSLLGMLTEHAYAIPGFRMVSVVLGRNPFTGEQVPLTAENLIGGFITLLPGGEATYQQLAETGVVGEAAARIESAMQTLDITWDLVAGTFLGLWDTLTLEDLLSPVDAVERVVALFGEPVGRILRFVAVVVQVVVELVLRLMNFPSDLLAHVIEQTTLAISDIQRDPVGFLRHMMEALTAGFRGFLANVGGYLTEGLVSWLFRGLSDLGITIPTEITFSSILGLVLDVLGLSIDFLWRKLGEHIGEQRVAMIRDALDTLGGAWAFLQDVQERGISALWEYVADQLGTLWSTILSMATEWVLERIIVNGTIKLLSFLDPTFIMSVVNGCIALFEAIRSTIEYAREILEIVDMYVSTLAAVARGDITPGAQMIERGLAAAIPVAIGFLAAQLGIGNIPDRIAEIIRSIREVVEAAIDWLITQALRLGAAALNALTPGATPSAAATTTAPTGDVSGRAGGLELLAGIGARRTVPMAGGNHQLAAFFRGGRLVIEIASARDYLLEKIELALRRPDFKKDPDGTRMLLACKAELESQEQRIYDAQFGEGEFEGKVLTGTQWQAVVQGIVNQETDDIAGILQAIGRAHDIDDLKESPYVLGGQIRREYGIRRIFYGQVKDDDSLRKKLKKDLQNIKRAQAAKWEAENPALYADGLSYVCPGWDYKSPHLTKEDMEIEHREEVVTHWNREGRGQTQDERLRWNNEPSNLTGMCWVCNNKKEKIRQQQGERGYLREVLDGFEGPPLSAGRLV